MGELRAETSAVVLAFDGERRRPLMPRSADDRRRLNIRPGPFLGIIVAHAALIAVVAATPGERVHVPATESLVSVILRPKVIVSRDQTAAALVVRVPQLSPMVYAEEIPAIVHPTLAVMGIGTMPPRPEIGDIDPAPFARHAGLRPGEGATVVLRVEVLDSGAVGRVEVDVSGGSAEIDQAAAAYARSVPWIGGMIDGRSATLWVRWGVRLQA
jgi:hypothetical protein